MLSLAKLQPAHVVLATLCAAGTALLVIAALRSDGKLNYTAAGVVCFAAALVFVRIRGAPVRISPATLTQMGEDVRRMMNDQPQTLNGNRRAPL